VETQRQDNLPVTVILTDRFHARRRARAPAPDASARAELRPGDRLSRFRILECLGGGGMGVVYRAEDLELKRTVALKVAPPHLCRNPDYRGRFRAEACAHARLNHPHVTTLYSFLELPEGEVLVLEYVEGETLADRVRREGPLPVSATLRIFEQVLLGVEHIHRMGVVHRDLKPSNIFITSDEQVKLMDFGVAKLMDATDQSPPGAMVGTLLYISPEQINGRQTDYRSDVYTLGISLFEALTGRLPFERRTDYALMHAHVQEAPPSPKDFHRRIPRRLEAVILKAIEKRPEQRFQTAAEFRTTLLRLGLIERRHRLARTRPIGPTSADLAPPERWHMRPRTRRRLLLGVTADLALVGSVLGFALLLDLTPGTPTPGLAPAVVAAPTPSVSKPPTVAASAPRPARPAAAAPRPVAVKHAPPPARDRYDSLRQAWGD
jgi:serine/threonine-protein kinase